MDPDTIDRSTRGEFRKERTLVRWNSIPISRSSFVRDPQDPKELNRLKGREHGLGQECVHKSYRLSYVILEHTMTVGGRAKGLTKEPLGV